MVDLVALKAANENRWAAAKLTRNFAVDARNLVGNKVRYQAVEAKTGVPWFIIAAIHMRESSQSWARSLAQGDPWDRVSVHVPAGRGPFNSWEDAAIDALVNCAPHLARQTDWSLGAALVALEKYNGTGYAARNKPSPYLWAGTNQYTSGKFVGDGQYDPNHVDTQPGCAGLIMAMMELDKSIAFGSPKPVIVAVPPVPKPAPKKVVTPTTAATGSVVAGTVAVGVQQGWGMKGWLIAAAVVAAVALVVFLIRRLK